MFIPTSDARLASSLRCAVKKSSGLPLTSSSGLVVFASYACGPSPCPSSHQRVVLSPALSSSLLLGVLIDVLLEDEIPLVRFVRQDKPLEGFLRFLFRLHLFLSPPQSR